MYRDTYYADNSIQVTDEWVKLNNLAYPISDIRAAKLSKVSNDPVRAWARPLIWSGALIFIGVFWAYFAAVDEGKDLSGLVTLVGLLAAINLVVGLIIKEFRKPQYVYVASIVGKFGRTTAVESKDEGYVRRVVEAIRKAIRNYR